MLVAHNIKICFFTLHYFQLFRSCFKIRLPSSPGSGLATNYARKFNSGYSLDWKHLNQLPENNLFLIEQFVPN